MLKRSHYTVFIIQRRHRLVEVEGDLRRSLVQPPVQRGVKTEFRPGWCDVSPTPCLHPLPPPLFNLISVPEIRPFSSVHPSKELSFVPSLTFPEALGAAVRSLWSHLSSRLNTFSCPSLFSQGICFKTQTGKEEQHLRCSPECFASFPVPSGSRTTSVLNKWLILLCVHMQPEGFLVFLKQNRLATRSQKIHEVSLTNFQLH